MKKTQNYNKLVFIGLKWVLHQELIQSRLLKLGMKESIESALFVNCGWSIMSWDMMYGTLKKTKNQNNDTSSINPGSSDGPTEPFIIVSDIFNYNRIFS